MATALTPADLKMFHRIGVDWELIQRAGVQRVDDTKARSLVLASNQSKRTRLRLLPLASKDHFTPLRREALEDLFPIAFTDAIQPFPLRNDFA